MSMYVPICDYSEPNSRLIELNANVRADSLRKRIKEKIK